MHGSINQSINQSSNQSINQSIKQSINQSLVHHAKFLHDINFENCSLFEKQRFKDAKDASQLLLLLSVVYL